MATSNSSPLIRGDAIPPSISEIAELGLHQSLLTTARNRKLVSPMSLQKHLWPIIIRGRSVVCASKHNSGKTVGYVLPLLSCIIESQEQATAGKSNEYGPIALVLVSSPEAAENLGKICSVLLASLPNVKCVSLHPNISECDVYCRLLNGCSILIATPEAFLKALLVPSTHRYTFTNLRRLSHFVIDEADVLLSKYQEPVVQILSEIGSAISSRKAEGDRSAGVQFVAMSSEWTKDVEVFYESITPYQPVLIRGAGCKDEKK